MKKIFLSLFALLLTSLWLPAQESPLETYWKDGYEKVRYLSYNICDGFHFQKETARKDSLVAWIRSKDPEIVALQELCSFNEQSLNKLAKEWGHPYSVIVKEGGYPVGITSKKPIKVINKLIDGYGHGLLHVQTYGYDFLVTHLNPHSADQRKEEANRIVQYIQDHQLHQNCILSGDLNSHSPMDADGLYAHPESLILRYGPQSKNLREGKIDYSVISTFLALPLIDACRKYVHPDQRMTFPTPMNMNIPKTDHIRKTISERLDYILVSPDLEKKIIDGHIYNTRPTHYLSDHFPVAIDLLQKKVE